MAERALPGCYVCGSAELVEDADPRNPLCATCLPAREHVVSMQRDAATGDSLAICQCGWRARGPWSHGPHKDDQVRFHWLKAVRGARAARMLSVRAEVLEIEDRGNSILLARIAEYIEKGGGPPTSEEASEALALMESVAALDAEDYPEEARARLDACRDYRARHDVARAQ